MLLAYCYNKGITKLDWLNKKRILLVALAVVFLAVIFFIKIRTGDLQNGNSAQKSSQAALAYDNSTVSDLVNADSNHNGIPDWEENILGPNLNQNDTSASSNTGTSQANTSGTQKINQTDQLGQQIFSTMSALNQAGTVSQDTINQVSDSLASQIQNPTVRKIYLLSDLTITQDNSAQAVQKYKNALLAVYTKYPDQGNLADVLNKFLGDGTNVDSSVLPKLTPIIQQSQDIINARIKTVTPSDLEQMHLDVINIMEKLTENLQDIQVYDSDPVVTLSAISKFNDNITSLQSAFNVLANAIQNKLSN